ncbi:MAG TPA: SDR family oxidoreductase [Candidatus Bathyarchaeia archaeon]|nr:SDR family oxidoreductase [Candidatus Bathyarchaeia archaeon]
MKIVVFGASGGTGKQLVEQALVAGYEVVVYVRNPSKLNVSHEHLTVIQGELSDAALIETAVKGTGAVLSALGPRGGSKNKPLTQGMRNIIAAMKNQGVRRLIMTSTLSAKDSKDKPDFRTKAMVNLVKTTMHAAYEDIVSVAETVRASDLEWTIVRLAILNNKPKSGKVKVGYVGTGEVGTQISRADIADFMLKQIEDTKYLREAPAISN